MTSNLTIAKQKMPGTLHIPVVLLLHMSQRTFFQMPLSTSTLTPRSTMHAVCSETVRRIACHMRCDVSACALGGGRVTVFLRSLLARDDLVLLGCTHRCHRQAL